MAVKNGPSATVVAATSSASDSDFRCREGEWSACYGRSGNEVRVRFCFLLLRRRMVSPATVVAATRSAADSNFRCREEEWFRLQNATTLRLQRFRISGVKLGNRCKVKPVYNLLRASILDFKPRLENRCKLFPVFTLFRASILDFKPKLGNRCSAIIAAQKNSPPAAWSGDAGGDRMARRRHNPK